MAYKFNSTLNKIVTTNLNTNKVPMLVGEPAIGKSSWVEALGEQLGTKTFTLQCNELSEKADLTGARTIPIDDAKTKFKQVFFPHADIMDAIEYARKNPDETPILFLDEINRTSSDLTSALLSIPTRRKIGNEELPTNLRIIIAGNDKGNVTTLDSASVSRFVIYTVIPDTETFLLVNPNLSQPIADLLMREPELIFCKGLNPVNDSDDEDDVDSLMDMFDDDTMEQFTAPRTITALSDLLNNLSEDTLKEMNLEQTTIAHRGSHIPVSQLMELLVSHTGYTEFTVKLYDEITKLLNQVKPTTISKPDKYDDFILNNSSTLSQIQAYAQTLTDDEKSNILVYALADKTNDLKSLRAVISELAKVTPMLVANDLTTYINKHKDGSLNPALDNFLRTKQDLQATTLVTYLKATTHD